MTQPSAEEPPDCPPEARRAIERAMWDWGVTGDMCALLTHKVLVALTEAGFVVTPAAEL